MALTDIVNRLYREYYRYTGDGKPGEPTNAPLPIGDRQSGVHSPKKSELREAFGEIAVDIDLSVEAAQAAAEAAEAALSSVAATSFPTRAAAMAYAPLSGPTFIRLEGYTSAGDGGGALYKRVGSQPTHAGKFSITLAVSGTVVWYEIAEFVIDPLMLGAVGFAGDRAAWGAVLSAGTYTNDYVAIQATLDLLFTRATGGEMRISRWHQVSTPLTVPYGVSIVGDSKFTCGIFKDSTTTKPVTYYQTAATTQVTIYPGNLPTAANAVLILGAAYGVGRWVGEIKGITIGGTYSTPANWSSQKVEFGILSIGSISDFVIDDNNVDDCRYGMLIPTPFVGQITNNRVTACLSGFGIGNCTTLTMHGNYANNCRDYGYAFRNGKYSSVFANACDYLNDTARHPDRARECSAYILDSCIGMDVFNNGQEGTLGNSLKLVNLRYCEITGNTSIRLGSDYTGAAHIAFIKVSVAIIGCVVTGNNVYEANPSGLTFGGANAAFHHNLYQEAGVYWNGTVFHNNVARATFNGLDAEAGWLNNNIDEIASFKRASVGIGTDPATGRRLAVRGHGTGSSTFALEVMNSAGTVLLATRDDGNVRLPTIGTTAAAANAVFDGSNFMLKSTSLRDAKDNIEMVSLDEALNFMKMDAQTFTSLCDADDPGLRMAGFIAEDAEQHAKVLAVYDGDGALQGFAYDRAPVLHHRVIQHLLSEIEQLKQGNR